MQRKEVWDIQETMRSGKVEMRLKKITCEPVTPKSQSSFRYQIHSEMRKT